MHLASLFLLNCLLLAVPSQTREDELTGWCVFYAPQRCRCHDQGGDLSLNCSNTNLTSVPELSEDSRWISVDLSMNNLRQLGKYEFARATISRLDLSHCGLHALHRNTFALSRGIQELSLAHNLLATIPVQTGAHLPMLKLLDLSYNPLLKVEPPILWQFAQLSELVLDGLANLTTGLDLSRLEQLDRLSISNANLTKLPADKMRLPRSLRSLIATNNTISTLVSSDQLSHVAALNLSYNRLENFPAGFKTGSLTVLDLRNNRIKHLQGFAFSNMPSLTRVYASNNSINEIGEGLLCSAGQNLSLVDLSYNPLKTFPICALSAHNASKEMNPHLILTGNRIGCNCSVTNTSSSWSLSPDICWFNETTSGSLLHGPCPPASTSCPSVCTIQSEDAKGRTSGSSRPNSANENPLRCLLPMLLALATVASL